MLTLRTLMPLILVSLSAVNAATVVAADPGPMNPVVLDKWAQHHTNITTYVNPGKKPDGTTDYNSRVWVPKVSLVVQLTKPELDDVVIIQHYQGDKPA